MSGAAVCVATVVLVFLLPLWVPLASRPIISASYVAGYSNSAGVFFVICISAFVFLFLKPRSDEAEDRDFRTLRFSSPLVLGAFVGTLAIQACVCVLVIRAHLLYLGDAGYLIEAVTVRLHTSRALYTEMEFAYGPLLLLPEVLVARALHLSPTIAYYLVYLTESASGMVLVFWIVNQMPICRPLRGWAVVLLYFGSITPHLGLNYTFLRFGAAPAILLWSMTRRSVWQCAGALAAGQIILVLLSPELAIAMTPAILLASLMRVRERGVIWAWVGAAPILSLLVALGVLGRPYLRMMTQFARGTLNLPIGPYPHILVLFVATLWLVPRSVSNHFDDDGKTDRTTMLCLYVLGLASLPAALGRCDPLHVFFDGAILMLLSLVAATRLGKTPRYLWVAAFALLVLWEQKVNNHLFAGRTAAVLSLTVMPHLSEDLTERVLNAVRRVSGPAVADELDPDQDAEQPVDFAKLGKATQYQPIATPLPISPGVEQRLLESRTDAPGYYAFWFDVFRADAELRAIEDVRHEPWMLLPADMQMSAYEAETPMRLADLQGLSLPYRARNAIPYYRGALFHEDLKRDWAFAGKFGAYVLYRNLTRPQSFNK